MVALLDQIDPVAAQERIKRENAFWSARHDEFRQRYADQFVAVQNGSVIAASHDLQDLLHRLEDQNLTLLDVWVRFIASGTGRFIL